METSKTNSINGEMNMTTAALITMIFAWAIIAYYTIKFFLKVLRTPHKENGGEQSSSS